MNNPIVLIRVVETRRRRGNQPKSTFYKSIADGLMTKPVHPTEDTSAWPDYEIEAINRAVVAGKSQDEIKALVKALHAARSADPVQAPAVQVEAATCSP